MQNEFVSFKYQTDNSIQNLKNKVDSIKHQTDKLKTSHKEHISVTTNQIEILQ